MTSFMEKETVSLVFLPTKTSTVSSLSPRQESAWPRSCHIANPSLCHSLITTLSLYRYMICSSHTSALPDAGPLHMFFCLMPFLLFLQDCYLLVLYSSSSKANVLAFVCVTAFALPCRICNRQSLHVLRAQWAFNMFIE